MGSKYVSRTILVLVFLLSGRLVFSDTIRVPEYYSAIQDAVDAAQEGDTILVSEGIYRGRIQLKPQLVLRSVGSDELGEVGLKRAEATILDGGGDSGDQPGVVMAEGSTLDGFTITNVGVFEETTWEKHFDSKGEELGDDEGAVRAEGTIPAVSLKVNCTVVNNIVHHNGDVGIAVLGTPTAPKITPFVANNVSFRNLGGGIGIAKRAQPIVRKNVCRHNLRAGIGCRDSAPFILENEFFANIRAGIGCREGARPIIRGNKCYQNRRAGIGVRMEGTAPILEGNECYENEMAGIGSRDGASPLVRDNRVYDNKMAGIGCDGSKPLIVGNESRNNGKAGIGLRGQANAILYQNNCIENKLVAVGATEQSNATLIGNSLKRTGGVPPVLAIKDGSNAAVFDNKITGGGVAALLLQGNAWIGDNHIHSGQHMKGRAVWVWQGSKAAIAENLVDGYSMGIQASESEVTVSKNTIQNFGKQAIVINKAKKARVFDNVAITQDEEAVVVAVQGEKGLVTNNVLQHP